MKFCIYILAFVVSIPCLAAARALFPDFESFSPEAQRTWGYTVHRVSGNGAQFCIHIPAKTAKLYRGAHLDVRDAHGQLFMHSEIGFYPTVDGGLEINVGLSEVFGGSVELIVATDKNEDTLLDPGSPARFDFGGFTFRLSAVP